MADLDLSVSISREELSLSPLLLGCDTPYGISRSGIGPGEVSFRRQSATSIFVPGSTLVHRVEDQRTSTLKVNIKAASKAQLFGLINDLCDAYSQFTFRIDIDIAGYTESWQCDSADWAVGDGGQWNDLEIRSNRQSVVATVNYRIIR